MAKLNFDPKKLVDEATRLSVEEWKRRITKEIQDIARPYGENPRITFESTSRTSFKAKFDVDSPKLKAEIEEYLAKSS